MPYDRSLYPATWGRLALECKEAAGWKCEHCGLQCIRPGEATAHLSRSERAKRTLTAAHLDHDPQNQRPRLAALCSACHLRYDAPEKARKRAEKKAQEAARQGVLHV
jgi:heterodisulfide reductase subunit B